MPERVIKNRYRSRFRGTLSVMMSRDYDNSRGMTPSSPNTIDDIDQQLNIYDDRMQKAKKRYEEICSQRARPNSLYYFDDNNILVNKVDETVNNQKIRVEEMKEKSLMRNISKAKAIEKMRAKREGKLKKCAELHKVTREEKFNTVHLNNERLNQEFEKFRKTKLQKFREKQRSIEEQK